jgi:hypothetical protein
MDAWKHSRRYAMPAITPVIGPDDEKTVFVRITESHTLTVIAEVHSVEENTGMVIIIGPAPCQTAVFRL